MMLDYLKFLLLVIPFFMMGQTKQHSDNNRIHSVVDSSQVNNVVLSQSFIVNVPLDSVWNAYTTKKGLESWSAAIAEVDFKINGTIKTSYNADGVIGDESTITLHVLNFVPKKIITLQAELTKNFPSFMKDDEKNLYNIICFDVINTTETRVTSYGLGYKLNDNYMSLMKFFIQGNEQSYLNLITYLETGQPSKKY